MFDNRRWLCASAATAAMLVASQALAQPVQTKRPGSPPAAAANKDNGEGTEVESVVVTGTFLRGTPETATIPVEGYNLEQMRNEGAPSTLDFVKTLSETGSVFGESNRAGQMGNGTVTINLRSLGSSRTVVVFNGRRMAEEYGYATGRSNNVATLPSCAIGRVEVLKDGGGTTYGADAVGGVVNYITRRNFDGVEAQAQYRYIKDSKGGDYSGCLTLGKVWDKGNVQASFGYLHRSELDVLDRDWAFVPYLRNPSGWSGVNNPGVYQIVQQTNPVTLTPITAAGTGLTLFNNLLGTPNNYQIGTSGQLRDPNCLALGGYNGWSGSGNGVQPTCNTANGLFENLVEESNTYQAYLEGNWQFSNRLKVHGEFTYYGLLIPHIPLDSFTAVTQAWPFARDKNGTPLVNAGVILPQAVGTSPSFLVPSYNPAVANFLAGFKNSDGSSVFSQTQLGATGWGNPNYSTNNYVALPVTSWRPFGVGGGALDGDIDDQDNRSNQYRVTVEFSGDLGKILIGNWDWSAAVTHGWGNYHLTAPDILVDRLQAALNGFGGPNCVGPPGDYGQGNKNPVVGGVPTVLPGTNGCQFYNPFPSAFPANAATGQTNPGYNAALVNDRKLVEWMYTKVQTQYPTDYDVIDLLLRSDLNYHLWSDESLQLAIGAQYRERHQITDTLDIGDASKNPCSTPGVMNCLNRTGPTVFRRHFNISGTDQDYNRRFPTEAAFAELKVPVTKKLNVQLSTRWEKYFSDLGAQDNAVVVSGGGVRYQLTEKVALRATAQQSFSQANPLAPAPDIDLLATSFPGAFGGGSGANYVTKNVPNTEVKPERGFNYNIGGVFQIGSNVTATLDYYNISIKSVIDPGGLSANTILNALAVPGETGATTHINCSSPLFQPQTGLGGHPFFEMPQGVSCVQGVTLMRDVLGTSTTVNGVTTTTPGGVVRFFGAQGQERRTFNGGSLDTSGVDANVRWRAGQLMGGDLSVTGDLSYILSYKVGAYQIAGIPYSIGYDGVGYVNNGSARPGGSRVNAWRGSLGFNWSRGKHNLNWQTRYVSSITNNDQNLVDASTLPVSSRNANIGGPGGVVDQSCPTVGIYAPPVPNAAGTGLYGLPVVVGGLSAIGFNPCQNTAITNGDKLYGQFISSFTWRLQLPKQVDLTFTIDNVVDADPKFSRDTLNYDSGSSVGPLGRTYQVSVRKTF